MMRFRASLSLLLFVFVSSFSALECSAVKDLVKLDPPEKGIYGGAFPDMGATEDSVTLQRLNDFRNLTGTTPAWVYFSNNWFKGIKFPFSESETIDKFGSVPFIRIMPRSDFIENAQDPVYTMQGIIDGKFDSDLIKWADDAKKYGKPLLAEFGTEVNGEWFSWNGKHNGRGTKTGYGDKNLYDGPERFIDAYRHIIDICRNRGAENITWFFHVDCGSDPDTDWNKMKNYYPGDDYIDWIGVSVYGSQKPGSNWEIFTDVLDNTYAEICSISANKPLALLEFGTVEDPSKGDKSKWIKDALNSIINNRYPRIKAISYWHSNWDNGDGSVSNMRIDSSPSSLKVYKELIANPVFSVKPVFK